MHCAATTDGMARDFGIPLVDLRRWPLAALRHQAGELVAAHRGELIDFSFDGIAFGKLAAMDLVLATKRAQLETPPPEVRHKWASFVEASVFSHLLFSRVLADLPVASLTHFNDYSIMLGARLAAERRGIPVFSITQASHLNNDNRRIVIRREIGPVHGWQQLDRWSDVRDVPLLADQVNDVCHDIILRLRATGSHTFSPAKTTAATDLRRMLGLTAGKKLIVAYTSSLDERNATTMTTLGAGRKLPAIREVFANQLEWLRSLANHVAASSHLELVVRIHPREGAGGAAARDGKVVAVESEHLGMLRQAFPVDPANCRIIWPDDDVSSYDLAEIADVATVSWSTIGLELARFGVPVVGSVLGYGPYVDDDFTRIPATREAYFATLEEALAAPISVARWARALRFYHHYFLGSAIDLRECVDEYGCFRPDAFLRDSPAASICDAVMVQGGRIDEACAVGGCDTELAEKAERRALLECAGRLLAFFTTGQEHGTAVLSPNSVQTPAVQRLWVLSQLLQSHDRPGEVAAGSILM